MNDLLRRVAFRALGDHPPDASRVELTQRGTIRLKEDARWAPFVATQWIDVSACAFRWQAKIKMAPLVSVHVVDAFENGRGRLDARLWNWLRLAHAEGPECDVGELMRYMAEVPWCPHAFRDNRELGFEDIGGDRLRVTRTVAGQPVSLDLQFDGTGDVVAMSAEARPRKEGKATVMRPWRAVYADHATMAGVRIPRRGVVSWILPTGVFEAYRGEITDFSIRGR